MLEVLRRVHGVDDEKVIVGGVLENDQVVLQWEGRAATKSGKPYNNNYCWVMRLTNGKVTEGTAYIDTELVTALWNS